MAVFSAHFLAFSNLIGRKSVFLKCFVGFSIGSRKNMDCMSWQTLIMVCVSVCVLVVTDIGEDSCCAFDHARLMVPHMHLLPRGLSFLAWICIMENCLSSLIRVLQLQFLQPICWRRFIRPWNVEGDHWWHKLFSTHIFLIMEINQLKKLDLLFKNEGVKIRQQQTYFVSVKLSFPRILKSVGISKKKKFCNHFWYYYTGIYWWRKKIMS